MVKRGLPAMLICSEVFTGLAEGTARGFGKDDLPLVVVPHPFGVRSLPEVTQMADEKVAEVAGALLRAKARLGAGGKGVNA